MPYPGKISAASILDAASARLGRHGLESLSLRAVAADLGVVPNALYRYYASHDELLRALGDVAAARLLEHIKRGVGRRRGASAVRAMAEAYLSFTTTERDLHHVFLRKHDLPYADDAAYEELRGYCVDLVAACTGPRRAPDTFTALWSFLYGLSHLVDTGFAKSYNSRTVRYAVDGILLEASR